MGDCTLLTPSKLNLMRVLLICVLITSSLILQGEINTANITSTSIKALKNCLNWKVVGECFWLKCGIDGCSVRVSAKVGHYRPDSVVSVYPHISSHPWKEMKHIVQKAFDVALPSMDPRVQQWIRGNGTEPAMDDRNKLRNLRYFEGDLFGHPLQGLKFPGATYFCDAVTTPLIPYYLSLTDLVAWRNPIVESYVAASVIPGRREIGTWPINTWGPVFPRQGWILQPSPPKAAAVIAQRVADIAINGGGYRVRKTLGKGRVNLWPPPPIRENKGATAKWQMLHPNKESECSAFGENDLLQVADWGGNRVDKKNTYMWSLWRPYKCCVKRGQWFLGSDDVRSYP